jgi:hypothetical protein
MLRQEIRRCPAPASVPPRCVHYTCLSLYIICHRGVTRIFQCRFQWRPPFRSNSSLSNKYRGTLCCNLLVSHILPCHIFPFIFIIRLGFNCAILIISSLMGRTHRFLMTALIFVHIQCVLQVVSLIGLHFSFSVVWTRQYERTDVLPVVTPRDCIWTHPNRMGRIQLHCYSRKQFKSRCSWSVKVCGFPRENA